MKFLPSMFALCCGLLLFAASCTPDQDVPEVTIEVNVPDPTISTLSNGTKKLDFSVEVKQTGNFFYQDFDFKLYRTDSTILVDNYHTLLTSEHRNVQHTSVVPKPGTYKLDVFVGPADNGVGSSSTIVVPQ